MNQMVVFVVLHLKIAVFCHVWCFIFKYLQSCMCVGCFIKQRSLQNSLYATSFHLLLKIQKEVCIFGGSLMNKLRLQWNFRAP